MKRLFLILFLPLVLFAQVKYQTMGEPGDTLKQASVRIDSNLYYGNYRMPDFGAGTTYLKKDGTWDTPAGTGVTAAALTDSLDVYRTAFFWDTTKIDTAQWGKFVRDHEATDFSWAASISDSLARYTTSYFIDTTAIDTAQWGKFVRDHESTDFDWAASIGDSLARYVTDYFIDTTAIDTAQWGKFVRDHESTDFDWSGAIGDSLARYVTDYFIDTTAIDTSQWGKFVRDHQTDAVGGTGIDEAALTDSLDVYRTNYFLDTTKIDTAQWGKFVRDHESSPDGIGVLAAALTDSLDVYRTNFFLDTTKVDTAQWGKFVRDHQTDAAAGGGLAEEDIDASTELAAIMDDETGTAGALVFSASPTLSGMLKVANSATADTLLNLTNDKTGAADSVFKVLPNGTLRLSGPIQTWGGNARGAGAVDLSVSRSAATQVASGTGAFNVGKDNTASGAYATCTGYTNTATVDYAISMGANNAVTNKFGVGMGYAHTVSGWAAVALGEHNTASGTYSTALNYYGEAAQYGQFSIGSGKFAAVGDAQMTMFVLRDTTLNATTHILKLDGVGGSNFATITATTVWYFEGEVVGWCYSGTDDNKSVCYKIEGLLQRDASNNTTLPWSSVTVKYENADLAACDCTLAADDTNERLNINVLGDAGDSIRWVAVVRMTQVKG